MTGIIRIALCIGLVLALSPAGTMAQGCSDAGFCTVGNLKAEPHGFGKDKLPKGRLTLITPVGVGDDDVLVFAPALQYDWYANERLTLQGKITGNIASGNLGSASGPGDIYLTANYVFTPKKAWRWQALLGVKMPLSDASLEAGGRPLPMQYQSSLGTFDLLAGISAAAQKWFFAFAWQQPLTQSNQNEFLPGEWPLNQGLAYPPSRQLMRKADILLRGTRQFNFSPKWTANAGMLAIWHLGEDEYLEPDFNSPKEINGSEGLTLNVTSGIWWQASSRTRVGLTGGFPLVIRDVRPDGLTRSFVIGPEISFSW